MGRHVRLGAQHDLAAERAALHRTVRLGRISQREDLTDER
jgi:hypothetical protein